MKNRSRIPKTALLLLATSAFAAEPGVTDLGQGVSAYNSRDFTSAVTYLKVARTLTAVSDYVTYHLAYSEVLTGDVDGALALLSAYRDDPIKSSPLAGKIDLLYGRTLLDKRDPQLASKALNSLQADYKLLPQPDGDFALGLAYEAMSEQMQAALAYERVYYSYPDTDLAAQSWTAIVRLRVALGKDFPEATARQQLDRCEKWLAARQYGKAHDEYSSLASNLTGPEKDEAKVGVGASDYLAGKTGVAVRYLRELNVADPNADAQRLYYVEESDRRSGDDPGMLDAVKELSEKYPKSTWRLKGLVAAGEHLIAANDRDKYLPLFRAVVADFPDEDGAAFSHWKLSWDAYENDKPEKVMLLKEHVEQYPEDTHASSALYFLGRISESNDKYGEARAYYDRVNTEFPHYFYAVLARQRLKEKVAAADPDKDVTSWLDDIEWPAHRDFTASEPNAATAHRIARARILISAGLQDLAESELRFGAKDENEQPQLLAMELAQSADSPYHALRIMKSFSADYLALPLDKAPMKFWQMLFPLPYKNDVFVNARERGLDPYDVAALIRQESEFNPSAKSYANAYGLMQLIPSTGRMVARQNGIRYISTRSLLTPEISIQLGTHYLRQQLDNWDGDMFRTLAAYNAGPGRVHQWLQWTNYREPAEFVESIPFDQTREYVQAVMRNADLYRQIYAGRADLEPEQLHKAPPVKIAALLKPDEPEPVLTHAVAAHSVTEHSATRTAATLKPVSNPGTGKTAIEKPAPKKARVTSSKRRPKTVVAKKSVASHTSHNEKKRDPA